MLLSGTQPGRIRRHYSSYQIAALRPPPGSLSRPLVLSQAPVVLPQASRFSLRPPSSLSGPPILSQAPRFSLRPDSLSGSPVLSQALPVLPQASWFSLSPLVLSQTLLVLPQAPSYWDHLSAAQMHPCLLEESVLAKGRSLLEGVSRSC